MDLLRAIEKDRRPLGGLCDGRAALEMIHAVHESHRQGGGTSKRVHPGDTPPSPVHHPGR